MYPVWRKRISYTITGAAKHCNYKKQPTPIAVLWQPVKRHTHIKRKKIALPNSELENVSVLLRIRLNQSCGESVSA
jgi:hypothetical protein